MMIRRIASALALTAAIAATAGRADAQAGQFAFPPGSPLAGSWGILQLCSVSAPTMTAGAIEPVQCAAPTGAAPYLQTSRGFQALPVGSSPTGFTAPSGATYCYATVEVAAIRFRGDGVNPTAGVGGGTLWSVGAQYLIALASLSNARFIAAGGTAGTLDLECFS